MGLVIASVVGQGVMTWGIPLAVLIAVLIWYLLLLRSRHPE